MIKRILLSAFLLLALAVGLYAMTGTAKGEGGPMDPTQTAQAVRSSQTATIARCKVHTGIANGTVNLRECKGASCGSVLDILTEGESLNIVTAGEYVNVTTESGVTGWLNKKYCKGK